VPPHLWHSDIGDYLTCDNEEWETRIVRHAANESRGHSHTWKIARYLTSQNSNLLCAYMYQPNVAKTQTKRQGTQLGCLPTLQRQNIEISKQIFPEKEYRGLSPNFHIHASVSDLDIPTIGLPILQEEICRPILGLYKSLTDL
jgi:hypothetical protein